MIKKFMFGFPFSKKCIYFGRYIFKNIAYFFNIFDKKPTTSVIPFSEKAQRIITNPDIMKHCAVVVHTCDAYNFLWNGFSTFFEMNWEKEIGLEKFFINETQEINFSGRQQIRTGGGEWNQRLISGLAQIDKEYIIYLQEDFRFLNKVSSKVLLDIIQFSLEHNLSMLKLHNGNKTYITEKTDKIVHKKNVSLVNKNSDYLLSHAVSLWKKDFLIEQLNKKSNETPRENEIIGTFRMKLNKKLPKIYQYDLFSTETETDDICHSSYREVCRKGAYNKNIKEFIDILLHKKYNTQ